MLRKLLGCAFAFLLAPPPMWAARAFNGTNQYITVGSSAAHQITGDLTISAWVNVRSVTYGSTSVLDVILGHGTGGETEATNFLYWLWLQNVDASNVKLGIAWEYGAGSNEETLFTTTISKGAWHHFLVYKDASANNVGFRLDGGTAEEIAYTNNTTGGGSGNVFIGALVASSGFIPADIAEVAIWNSAIMGGSGTGAMRNVLGIGPMPIAYWPLWGVASPEPDLSGSAKNGTVTGATAANHSPTGPYAGRGQ